MSDKELTAMQTILSALDDLEDSARERVLSWATNRLGLKMADSAVGGGGAASRDSHGAQTDDRQFPTFAELFNAMSPTTNAEKVLAAAYWLQVCCEKEQYTSQSVNKELQDLGYSLKNVTAAFTALKDRKPALAIQVKKSGKSQQARKLYKLTQAGLGAVNRMLRPAPE